MQDLSVCIVSYNDCKVVIELLENIFTYTEHLDFKVYVVDNNSSDDTVKRIKSEFPMVHLIENKTNEGFGKANNAVLSLIDSKYHAIVNPDIGIKSNIFKILKDYMDRNEDAALVSPRILNSDGSEQFLPKRMPNFRYTLGRFAKYAPFFQKIRTEYTRSDEAFTAPAEIDFCTGCFMFVRSDYFKKLGGFDEDFFMYLEDAELSSRMHKLGKLIFYPNASVVHKWERTSAKSIKYLFIHARSLFIFRKKMKNVKKENAQRGTSAE